jgi:tRNA 2-thiocytidine biosynthesis protein TtcA
MAANELKARINRRIGQVMMGYHLIQEGDRILVAVSGGKDSLCLLHFMEEFRRKAPVHFEILACNLDQGQPGFPVEVLPALFKQWQIPYSIVIEKTPAGKTTCALCSRLRRGVLYRIAREKNCNKIALGHHREDIIETFLLNAFFNGKLGSMPPVYRASDYDLSVIRPLAAVEEKDLAEYARLQRWPIIPCNLCGSQDNLRRRELKGLLSGLEEKNPHIKHSLFKALSNPHLEELFANELWADPAVARADAVAVREPVSV